MLEKVGLPRWLSVEPTWFWIPARNESGSSMRVDDCPERTGPVLQSPKSLTFRWWGLCVCGLGDILASMCVVWLQMSVLRAWLTHETYPLTPNTRAHLPKKTSTLLQTIHGFIPSPQLHRRFLSYFLSSQVDGADMNGTSSWPLMEELKCEPRGGSQSWCSLPQDFWFWGLGNGGFSCKYVLCD